MLSRPDAIAYATRLAAVFPRASIGKVTINEWAEEFIGIDSIVAASVLDRLKERYDQPPSVKQIRSAVLTERNAADRGREHAKALSWGASSPTLEEPTTFADWAKTDPVRARKLVAALDGKSYVKARIEDVIARGTEIFDALATGRRGPSIDDHYIWNRHDPPCDHCRRPVENGPNSQARYDRDTDTWTNAHVDCPPPSEYTR